MYFVSERKKELPSVANNIFFNLTFILEYNWFAMFYYSVVQGVQQRESVTHVCAQWLQSYLTLCDPLDCSPPGSSVYGISQARILEWVALSSSRGSSWPRDGTQVSCIGRQILYCWVTREAPKGTFYLFRPQYAEMYLCCVRSEARPQALHQSRKLWDPDRTL